MAGTSRIKKGALVIVYRPIDALVPYARNSREHSDEQVQQIVRSIQEFGFTNPVLIDEAGSIIAGHGRVMAARHVGLTEVPTITLAGLTDDQRRAYVIADNKLALNAGWDMSMLRDELLDLQDGGFAVELLGFTPTEIEVITKQVEPGEFPALKSGEGEPYQQMAFTLHDEQAETVKRALEIAKNMGEFDEDVNKNPNGNAIARVCEIFITLHGSAEP